MNNSKTINMYMHRSNRLLLTSKTFVNELHYVVAKKIIDHVLNIIVIYCICYFIS